VTTGGTITVNAATASLFLNETDTTDENTQLVQASGTFRIRTADDSGSNVAERLRIDHGTGDVSFYENTGTTAKMVWDASAESLNVDGPITVDGLTVDGTATIQKATGATLTVTNTGDDIATIVLGNTGSHNTFLTQENGVFTIEDPSVGSRLSIADNGDLSLYEDTGTTEKFFWDASQELLLIGEDASNRIGTGANLALGDSDGGLLSIGSTKVNDFNAGDIMGSIEFRNVDGSVAEKTKAKIVAVDDTSTGASAHPLGVALAFSTISSGTLAEGMRLDSSGTLSLNHNLREAIYNLTGTDINPVNGSVQYKTLAANTTFTESLADGDSVILRISGGDTYTVTWPTMTWVTSGGNAAPTLGGSDVVVLWQESSTVYGAYVGSYA
jgi:hypothetical protein